MFLILAEAMSPAFLLGYALWNTSFAFVSGADQALLYDTLKADGRESEAAKQSGRSAAIQMGSQGIAALAGAALATIDITLCFTLCGIAALVSAGLILTVKEPPHHEEGEEQLGYWQNLRTGVGIAARRPIVRTLLLLSATFFIVPLIVYYFLLQPYALEVGLPIAALGLVVVGIQAATVAASWLAYRTEGALRDRDRRRHRRRAHHRGVRRARRAPVDPDHRPDARRRPHAGASSGRSSWRGSTTSSPAASARPSCP